MPKDTLTRRDLLQGGIATAVTVPLKQLSIMSTPGSADDLPRAPANLSSKQVEIWWGGSDGGLWQFRKAGQQSVQRIGAPVFSVDGQPATLTAANFDLQQSTLLPNGSTRYLVSAQCSREPNLRIDLEFEINDYAPIVRFRYHVSSAKHAKITKPSGHDDLTYLTTSLADYPHVQEVTFSKFDPLSHTYRIDHADVTYRLSDNGWTVMGPIIVGTGDKGSLLLAYEHGSEAPNAFLNFNLSPLGMTSLAAAKGNYLSDQPLNPSNPYTTIWMQAGIVDGDIDQMSSAYRRYILDHFSQTNASRRPNIYYNTWNFQERNKWFNGKPYLSSMNSARIMEEIEVAHELGIDVFVLDTGWYEKTGDWTVSKTRFPDGLRAIKEKLVAYGMRLGLWFGPTSAAASSTFVSERPEWRMSRNGIVAPPREVWETEKSFQMCLVSGYADAFAAKLIQLANEIGVTYFKWDAIDQYGCDDPHHDHGSANHSSVERKESYAFQLIRAMCSVVDKVSAAIPDAIVDFDITEAGRAIGLAFLASGKYFQANNGPYYWNYDIPVDPKTTNVNMFFYQGQARSWIMRSQLSIDRWIPSILYLAHYFPDDPWQWQEVSVASLVLGQNGLWGDLPSISSEGRARIAETIRRYKQVADHVTHSDPKVTGFLSGSPEIHEKIHGRTGKGVICIFATTAGTYKYVTQRETCREFLASEDTAVSFVSGSRALIEAKFDKPGAKIFFFGATKPNE